MKPEREFRPAPRVPAVTDAVSDMEKTTMKFINPENNYIESVSAAGLWCLLFGPLYFLSKGVIFHAVISFVVAIGTAGISWLIYPFFARGAVRKAYLRAGWIEISRPELVPFERHEVRTMRTSHAA